MSTVFVPRNEMDGVKGNVVNISGVAVCLLRLPAVGNGKEHRVAIPYRPPKVTARASPPPPQS